MSDFLMPSLGADMDSATLVEWLVKPGDSVKRGDVIAVVETAKGAIEIEVFESGVVDALLIEVETEIDVGTPLARIRGAQQSAEPPVSSPPMEAPSVASPVEAKAATEPEETEADQLIAPHPSPSSGERLRASPLARARSSQQQLDLEQMKGSGPAGAILARDLPADNQASEAVSRKAGKLGFDPGAMRKAIASAMARSKREIPHYYLQNRFDMSAAVTWLAEYNAGQEPAQRLILSALLLRATVLALQSYPEFNGFWQDEAFQPSTDIHLGMAINIRSLGLITPALRNLEQASLAEVMLKLQDVTKRARNGGLRSSEVGTATLTVTALGERGVDSVFGVIFPPQVAILGFGRMHREPVAVGDALAVRPIIQATLAADHRVSDGHRGALFLDRIGQLLNEPAKLAESSSIDKGAHHD
ncbi:MAG: 2-oxo acid dehydrogenase subunit E2 [Saccharospirillum sp.]|nr:2-oxo acid dehydrogenase subunit E2 [Saccharospirillum sp.]